MRPYERAGMGLNDPPCATTPWGEGVSGQGAAKKFATPRPCRGALHAPFPCRCLAVVVSNEGACNAPLRTGRDGFERPAVRHDPLGRRRPGSGRCEEICPPRPCRGALHAPFSLPIPLPSLCPTRAHAMRPYERAGDGFERPAVRHDPLGRGRLGSGCCEEICPHALVGAHCMRPFLADALPSLRPTRAHAMRPAGMGLSDPPVATNPWGKSVPGQGVPKKFATPRPCRGALHAPFPCRYPCRRCVQRGRTQCAPGDAHGGHNRFGVPRPGGAGKALGARASRPRFLLPRGRDALAPKVGAVPWPPRAGTGTTFPSLTREYGRGWV
jgi:hypothetical protein